ncbi:hypothetical protein ACFE04_010982 [Oxalis oulophora]
MMMILFPYWLVFMLLLLLMHQTTSYSGVGPHIADVNLLLPPKMTYPVEYLLQGSGGCFKWSWDHHDILSVEPEYNSSTGCSTSARLKSFAPYSGRKETAVYAADVQTGTVIRCKVFIDNISRLQIFHNSIKLDLDGLSTLRVRAFDAQENVFSSLVGLQFKWQLKPEASGSPHHLAHVPLKDSPLSDCGGLCGDLDIQIKLEDIGVFSDLFVVKGIEIGHEIVSVNLFEPQFKHMGDKIVLTVAEAMSLDPPSPVFVLVGAVLRYKLKVIRGNFPQVVTLPSPHHQWSVSNSSVAFVESKTGLTSAQKLGATAVIVEDTRVNGHTQLSSLNVVLPESLRLYMSPLSISGDPVERMMAIPSGELWYVVSGRQYLVQAKVYTQHPSTEEIYITESDELEVYDDSEYWKTSLLSDQILSKHCWRNSRILKATSQGLGLLTASLTYFGSDSDQKEALKVVQDIMVCDQVKLSLSERRLLLPWVPSVYQEVELKATGGCAKSSGDYKWFSSDLATVSVSASGIVQGKKPGNVTVKVLSTFDLLNYDEVTIEVSVPSSMVMLQNFPVENVVGSHLQAATTMKASNGEYFYKCNAFNSFIKWKTGSESFVVLNSSKGPLDNEVNFELHSSVSGPPCSWTYVYASSPGQTMLHATLSKEYQPFDHTHGPIALKATSRIAAFPPLILHQVGNGNQFGGYQFDSGLAEANIENLDKLYLAPGTHMDVMLFGGPEPWEKGVDFIETVKILDGENDDVDVRKIYDSSRNSYRISCKALRTSNLVFKRGNLVGDDHPLPAIAEVSLPLTCSIPSSIALIVDEPVNERGVIRTAIQADRGPGKIRITPVTVANGRIIRVAAVGIGDSGEIFANSSSLCLKWELTGCEELAYWDDASTRAGGKSIWERFLVLRNESGLCIVRATVLNFCESTSHHFAHLLGSSETVLTDAIRLQLVSTLRVEPEFNLIYLNPDAKSLIISAWEPITTKVNLSITGGSCFLEAVVNDTKVVEVIHSPQGLKCSQLMLSPKSLGNALVTVYDIGLAPPLTASATVQVADVEWIKIVSGEEISLMEGTAESITVLTGISDGNTFSSSQYAYMNFQLHIEENTIVDIDDFSYSDGEHINMSSFKILAKHLGTTTLYVSIKHQSGYEIVSQPIKIEVYASPRIQPHTIFLVPGANYGVSLKGGPTIGVHVNYATMDDGVAIVDSFSGRLTAMSPGNTTLVSTIYGNGDVVICRAYGVIKVGVPSSALLSVQSEKLSTGRLMPIYPSFPEGDLFSFYELCKSYKWTIENEKVLSFHDVEHSQKHNVASTSNKVQFSHYMDHTSPGYIKVLQGRWAGSTKVSVTFSCDFISGSYAHSGIYRASTLLSVVPDLPLSHGVAITWVLPPNYITSSLLPLSLESHGARDIQSRKGTIIYSILRDCGEKNLKQEKGISIDGDRIRTADSDNLACIQAKVRSTGRMEIASCVRVAEVAQIRVTAEEFPFHTIDLPIGAELDIPITYCDTLGNPFYEAENVVLYSAETNYPDIVSISSMDKGPASIHLKAMRHGKALVRVSIIGSPQNSDYVLISVGARIFPRSPLLRVGNRLNFSIEGFDDKVSGEWISANGSVISVDRSSGVTKAVGVGSTLVYFNCPSMKLQTTVTVVSGNTVFVDAPKQMLTNVPFPTKGYSFSVKFGDTYDEFKAVSNGKAVSYDCSVDPPFVGYTKSWIDPASGNAYCLFFPYSPNHLVHLIPKLEDVKPYVYVVVNASLREANHVSGSASALFIGGFSVKEMDEDSVQLNFTPEFNKTIITIMGNTDVDMHWNDKDSMRIRPIHKEDLGIAGQSKYEIEVVRAKRIKDKIIITLPATGQVKEIDVNFEPGSGTSTKSIMSRTAMWSLFICLAVLGLAAAGIARLDRPSRSQQPTPSTTPNTPPPRTPMSNTPISDDRSPGTPSPFMEYVRQTIDETPYYRRDARRRFNPQNTY